MSSLLSVGASRHFNSGVFSIVSRGVLLPPIHHIQQHGVTKRSLQSLSALSTTTPGNWHRWHLQQHNHHPTWRYFHVSANLYEDPTKQASPELLIHTLTRGNEGNDDKAEETSPSVVHIVLNRPKANAMGRVIIQQLQDCLNTLEEQRLGTPSNNNNSPSPPAFSVGVVGCVVVSSSVPGVFSAGADLKERATMTPSEAEAFVCELRNTMERVSQLPIPVIAALDGIAVGGGLELALAADLIIASSKAKVGFPETSLAIIPGAGGTQRLPRVVGVARAKELIWTGRRISAMEAYQYGLVQEVVDCNKEDASDGSSFTSVTEMPATKRALELAWDIATTKGPIAIRASKEAIHRGLEQDTMNKALEVERTCYAKVLSTKDRLEGLAAFRDGRKPQYKGE